MADVGHNAGRMLKYLFALADFEFMTVSFGGTLAKKRTSSDQSALASSLRKLMQAHKVSVRQMAKIAETNPSSISDWLRGERSTQYECLIRLCRHFNVTLEWLVSGDDEARAAQIPTSLAEIFKEAGSFQGYCRFKLDLLVPASESPKKPDDGE